MIQVLKLLMMVAWSSQKKKRKVQRRQKNIQVRVIVFRFTMDFEIYEANLIDDVL